MIKHELINSLQFVEISLLAYKFFRLIEIIGIFFDVASLKKVASKGLIDYLFNYIF